MPVKARFFLGGAEIREKTAVLCQKEKKNVINMSKQIPITPAFYCAISVYQEVFLSDTISKDVHNVQANYE